MTYTAPHIITDGRQLVIADFRICMFEGDLSPLGGEPEEREAAWVTIRSQYFDWFGGTPAIAFALQVREVNILASKIERVQILVGIARELAALGIAAEEIAEELTAEGYHLDINGTHTDYMQQLNGIDARLAPDRARLRRLSKDFPQAKNTEDESAMLREAEDGFEGMLVEVTRYLKMELDEHKTTLYRLYQIVKRMMKTKPKTDG